MIRIYQHNGYSIEIIANRVDEHAIEYYAEIRDSKNDVITAEIDVIVNIGWHVIDVIRYAKTEMLSILRDLGRG